MAIQFQKATKKETYLRMAIDGPAKAGKTFTTLRVLHAIGKRLGGRIAVIDTERKSASKYANEENPDGGRFDFDVLELETHHPDRYVEAIEAAERAGYVALGIDSLSHAWMGKEGALEQVDRRNSGGNSSFFAWKEVTPMHNRLVDKILTARLHVICTLRSKMDFVVDKTDKGKTEIRKVGLAPVMREGIQYEFDVLGDVDMEHYMTIGGSRCSAVDGRTWHKAGADLANVLMTWLDASAAEAAAAAPVVAPASPTGDEKAAASVVQQQPTPTSGPVTSGDVKPLEQPKPPTDSDQIRDRLIAEMEATTEQAKLDTIALRISREIPKDSPILESLRDTYNTHSAKLHQGKAA